MIFVALIALSLSISSNPLLHTFVSTHAPALHQKCTKALPPEVKHLAALNSLVCGKKITDRNLEHSLLQTSLIHLFVISGSHLILADQFFSKLALPFAVRFLFLSFYSILALAEAPVIRALVTLTLREGVKNRWYWKNDLIVFIAGLLTLLLFPLWKSSLSLQLSWAAALALTVPSLFSTRKILAKIFIMQLAVFFFLVPLLWGFGSLHPLSLVFNIVLGPVIAFLLLPLGILTIMIPPLSTIFDFAIDFFQIVSLLFSDPITLPSAPPLPREWLWVWIGTLHAVIYFVRILKHQGKDQGL